MLMAHCQSRLQAGSAVYLERGKLRYDSMLLHQHVSNLPAGNFEATNCNCDPQQVCLLHTWKPASSIIRRHRMSKSFNHICIDTVAGHLLKVLSMASRQIDGSTDLGVTYQGKYNESSERC